MATSITVFDVELPNIIDDEILVFLQVALVIAPNRDYHWYRQNSDGTWSHKPGKTAVVKVDRPNEIIYDPETCDRTTGSPSYSVFIK